MVQTILVASVLFGLMVVGIAAYLSSHEWRQYTPLLAPPDGRSSLARAAESPAVWTAVFLVVVVGFGLAVVAAVSGNVSEGAQRTAGLLLAAGTAIGLTLYLFYGTFVSARNHGLTSSQAAAVGSWAIGLLFILVVVFKLMGVF